MTVETPEGPVSGSSVTAVEWWDNLFQGCCGAAKHYSLTGEAVAVDLSQGRYLFALLKPAPGVGGESIADLATQVATGKPGRQWSREAFGAVRKLPRPATVPAHLYPLLVTFDDIDDPTTVRRVNPDDLAATFGPGYALKGITLEITKEKVTEGRVESVLGWWLDYRGGPYNSMKSLQLPDNSPRGWDHLSALAFWSLDRVTELNERSR